MIEDPRFRLKVLMFDFLKKHFLFTWLDVGHRQTGAGPSIESRAYRFRSPDQLGLWICDMPFWAVKSRGFLAACGLSQERPELPLSHLSCSCDHGWARVPAAERSLGHRLSASRQVSTIQQKAQPLCCDSWVEKRGGSRQFCRHVCGAGPALHWRGQGGGGVGE